MPGLRLALLGPFAGFPILLALGVLCLRTPASTSPSNSDASREALFDAYRKGMPLDSLYFLLAGQALRRLSFDTAMAFNLSIPTPVREGFRDSVLAQRYRLYRLSGLNEDAARLRDSLPSLPEPSRERRPVEWAFRIRSGYSGEDQGYARSYPSGRSVPGLDTGGWLGKSQGNLNLPIPSPARVPLSLGLGYDLAKSYYKDSLDYRAEIGLRADRILDRFSGGISLETGRIAGVGVVSSYKGDLTWISIDQGGYWIGHAGYESEWEGFRDKRYDAAWMSLLREWDLGAGRSLQGSLAGTLLLLDPFQVAGMGNVIFVDDVSNSRPTHYSDASFQDSIPGSPAVTALYRYTQPEARDSISFLCSQDAFTVRPGLSFGLPVGMGVKAELDLAYGFTFYPQEYAWKEVEGVEPVIGDSVDFRGYALNRADGRYYRAFLFKVNGGFDETYSDVPLRERRVRRMDHRFGADFAFVRAMAGWGQIRVEVGAERTISNLSDQAPVWIPEWDYGASVRWSMAGRWPR